MHEDYVDPDIKWINTPNTGDEADATANDDYDNDDDPHNLETARPNKQVSFSFPLTRNAAMAWDSNRDKI